MKLRGSKDARVNCHICPYARSCTCRSGELASEYEKKKAAMSQAAEETAFTYHKRRVSLVPVAVQRLYQTLFHGWRDLTVCLCVLSQGITLEKKEARAEKEEAERYQKLQQELVSP